MHMMTMTRRMCSQISQGGMLWCVLVMLMATVQGAGGVMSRKLLVSSTNCSELLYTIQSGDTIANLASTCGTDTSVIQELNPQIPDIAVILVGDKMCLPTICAGKIAGLSPSQAPPPSVTPPPVSAANPPSGGSCSGQQYTVKSGDTIANLAASCGSTADAFKEANPQIKDIDQIFVGQQLCLPAECSGLGSSEGPAAEVSQAPPPSGAVGSTSGADAANSSSSLSGGAIAGIVVGVLVGLAVVIALVFLLLRKKQGGKDGHGHLPLRDNPESQQSRNVDSVQLANYHTQESTKSFSSGASEISAVPYSNVVRSSDVVDMGEISLPRSRSSTESFDNLPMQWRIPLGSVKLLCQGGGPIILGKGGYGVVYKAIVRREDAAIKIVKGGGKNEQARLLHEITILEKCKSVHIVQFLGFALSEDGLLLCMEYMSGGTLYNSLGRSNEFQWYNRGWKAMRSIAAGLYCMHEQDVAHLDLKTPNILINGSEKNVKIADLGLGKLVRGQDTQATQFGTVAWMAPEVLLKGTCALQSDAWSLSTILWEVCTLRRPEFALKVDEIVVPDEGPQELVDLIKWCRAENYWERPSIKEICDLLDSIPHSL